jgi:hypothetical protein
MSEEIIQLHVGGQYWIHYDTDVRQGQIINATDGLVMASDPAQPHHHQFVSLSSSTSSEWVMVEYRGIYPIHTLTIPVEIPIINFLKYLLYNYIELENTLKVIL